MIAVCPICGVTFKRSRAALDRGRGTCSRACGAMGRRGRVLADDVKEKIRAGVPARIAMVVRLPCVVCGAVFERAPSKVEQAQQHFCSQGCARAYPRGERAHQWKGDAVTKTTARIRTIKAYPRRPCESCGTDPPGRSLHRHHIDGNPWNNVPENVRVLCAACHRQQHGVTSLTEADVRTIRAALDAGCGQRSLGRQYDTSPRNIRRIGSRETWRHVEEDGR